MRLQAALRRDFIQQGYVVDRSISATSGDDVRQRVAGPASTLPVGLALGLSAVCLFVMAATYRLERPGLYYDELHQATGAFAYVDKPSGMFSLMPVWGVPVMNMPYSGAIKTAIYGSYLRATGYAFSVRSWRLVGLIFVALGIVAFCVLAAGRIRGPTLVVFLVLLLTDVDLLLQTRHDWGPVTLAFLLRAVFLGVWLGRTERPRPQAMLFTLGLIVGIAIFEKLSSTVLLGPLALIAFTESRSRLVAGCGWAVAGVLLGALPVVVVNALSMSGGGMPLGLTLTSEQAHGLLDHLWLFVTLGNGALERGFVLGDADYRWAVWLEGGAVVGSLLVVGIAAVRHAGQIPALRLAAVASAAYVSVGFALYWLPAATAENHWIIGTPFHYLAVALGAEAMWVQRPRTRMYRGLLVGLGLTLIVARLPPLWSTFESIRTDSYSTLWDSSNNAALAFAAGRPPEAAFIAADWGVATQVFCLSNGRQDFVFEPYWDYRGRASLSPVLDDPRRTSVWVATLRPRADVRPEATVRILHDVATDAGWREVPVEPWLRAHRTIELRHYRRRDSSAKPSD